jgi:hypothetical protein
MPQRHLLVARRHPGFCRTIGLDHRAVSSKPVPRRKNRDVVWSGIGRSSGRAARSGLDHNGAAGSMSEAAHETGHSVLPQRNLPLQICDARDRALLPSFSRHCKQRAHEHKHT